MRTLLTIAVLAPIAFIPLQVFKDLNVKLFQAVMLAVAAGCLIAAGIIGFTRYKR